MPEKTERGWLYVIDFEGEDLVKIGFSQDPHERVRAFHYSTPLNADRYAIFTCGDGSPEVTKQEEKRLHELFRNKQHDDVGYGYSEIFELPFNDLVVAMLIDTDFRQLVGIYRFNTVRKEQKT